MLRGAVQVPEPSDVDAVESDIARDWKGVPHRPRCATLNRK
jgi:hypothetical protein